METEVESTKEVRETDDAAAGSDTRAGTIAAPYMSFTGFKNLLDRLGEDGVPGRFDKSYFGNISGSLVAQTRQSLRYFDLIDDDQHPTDVLRSIVEADELARKQILLGMFNEKYADALALSHNATSGQLADVFRERGLSGATVVKSMNFFLGMAEEVGVGVSPHFKKGRVAASANGTRKRRAAKTTPPPTPPPPANPPTATSREAQRAKYVEMLMNIAAKSEGQMPDKDLLDRIEKAIGLDTGAPEGVPTSDPP